MAETASELQEGLLISHKESKALVNYDDRDRSMSTKGEGGEPEVLHDGLSFGAFMVAGSVAGMVEHMAMFPVDTLKTRMQMLAGSGGLAHSGVGRAIVSIVKSEGPLGLYRGIGAMGLGAGPAHAVYFTVYEVCKERLGGNRFGHHPVAHGASGILATIASDAVFTPMDVVKQRLQLRSSPYGGVWDCIKRMLREEGFRSFYVSYRTTVVMNAPFTAVHFATYEAAKKTLMGVSPENATEEHLVVHVTAGGLAGALASAVTTPLDVVKTRLQCQITAMKHPAACPVVTSIKKRGLGWLGTLIIILCSIFAAYFLTGVAYRFCVLGIRGKEVIPNLEFWLSIPGRIQVGLEYILNKIIDTYYRIRQASYSQVH